MFQFDSVFENIHSGTMELEKLDLVKSGNKVCLAHTLDKNESKSHLWMVEEIAVGVLPY